MSLQGRNLASVSEIDKSYSRHFGSYSEAVTELLILEEACFILDGKVIPLESFCVSMNGSQEEVKTAEQIEILKITYRCGTRE